MARAQGRRTGDACHRAAPARSARPPRTGARPDPAQPSPRLPTRRLGDAHLRTAQVLRLGRLARRPADGRVAALARPHAPRAEPAELDRIPARARTGDRRDARGPRRARHCQQSRVRNWHTDPHRQLPRPQGQLTGAPLPVADRRRDDLSARRLRARLCPHRGCGPARADPRERPRHRRRLPHDQAGRRRWTGSDAHGRKFHAAQGRARRAGRVAAAQARRG